MLFLRKSRKGFTLIELMVVVAIIGVLALLGLRVYSTQQDKAKEALVKANAGSVQVQIQTELVDNPDYDAATAVSAANGTGTITMNLQNPFTGGKDDVAGELNTLPTEETLSIFTDPNWEGKVGVFADDAGVFYIIGYGKDGVVIPKYTLTARR
jgi:type IV pilus assembly protein PilA